MSRLLLALSGLLVLAAGGPLESYNDGVEFLEEGKLDDAISDLESAVVDGEGPVRAAALHNLGLAHARKGETRLEYEGEEEESREAAMRRLTEAASSFRRALALFRRVSGPAPDSEQGAKAAKVRLMAALDELQRLAEEAEREAREKALENPFRFLLETLTGERDRRRAAVALEGLTRRRLRIPARRLRQAEYEARTLVELLASRLENPPEGSAPGPVPPEAGKAAAETVKRAAAAMAEAEGRLDGRDPTGAATAQTRAIRELAEAARRLPVELGPLVGKLLGDQQSLLGLTERGGFSRLAEEQSEVRSWLAHIAGTPDPDPRAGPGGLDAETAGEVRRLAKEAELAAGRSGERLAKEEFEASVPEQKIVIEKLEAIRELLPKPPEPPAEKIRRLIREEREVKDVVAALEGLAADSRREEAGGLGERQTENGREAGGIAEELEGSPGEREKEAAKEVRAAEEEIHASSESLRRVRVTPAGESIDRAIERLEEALRILSGEQDSQPDSDRGQPESQPDSSRQEENRESESQDARKLDSREARRMMEEMDRERREEEEKLFRGLGGPRVEKDW